jgi:hypothetical protein
MSPRICGLAICLPHLSSYRERRISWKEDIIVAIWLHVERFRANNITKKKFGLLQHYRSKKTAKKQALAQGRSSWPNQFCFQIT